MLHSRQASNNSNQQSSLDDSGVVDDHDGDDVTSAEEQHDKRESHREHRVERSHERSPRDHSRIPQQSAISQPPPRHPECPPAPVTVSVRTGNREIRVLKCNGVKTKKHMYALPPEYLSHIVVLGEWQLRGVCSTFIYFFFKQYCSEQPGCGHMRDEFARRICCCNAQKKLINGVTYLLVYEIEIYLFKITCMIIF